MSKKYETKADKFRRLAESRVNKALKSIQSIASLSNRNNYDYTNEEVNVMIKALKVEILSLEKAFKKSKSKAQKFKF